MAPVFKIISTFLPVTIFATAAFCQLPDIRHNYSKADSTENPLLDSFSRQFDFVLSYTEQGYWQNYKYYQILAYKKSADSWSTWTYSNYVILTKKKNRRSKLITDTVRTGLFFRKNMAIPGSLVKPFLDSLSANNFWHLNNDSLNQTRIIETYIDNGDTIHRKAGIADAPNYRFDIITRDNARVIESYAPQYFLHLFPDMTERRQFLRNRELFEQCWKKWLPLINSRNGILHK